jgi:hypothetical protein
MWEVCGANNEFPLERKKEGFTQTNDLYILRKMYHVLDKGFVQSITLSTRGLYCN